MALATLVYTVGNGMFMVVSVLYFTRIVGLGATQVGLGLTIAGLFGLLAGVPLGHLGDRVGPRELLIGLLVLSAPAFAALALVTSWWQFVVVVSLATSLDRGSAAVRSGLIASSEQGADRIRARAYLRSMTNIGMAVGAVLAALALLVDTQRAYTVVLLANGASCLLAALLLCSYPHVRAVAEREGASMTLVFRDRPFLVMTALMAAMAVQYSILDIGVPLWLTTQTSAPRVMVSVLFVINTTVVVLYQVAVSRRVETIAVAARVISWSGLVFFAACVLFALAQGRSPLWAAVVFVVAALAHVLGELLQAAAQFCLSQELAIERAQGQYQGLSSTGYSLAAMLAPSVIVLLPIRYGATGWVVLGLLFAVIGLLLRPAVAWTEATRSRYALI